MVEQRQVVPSQELKKTPLVHACASVRLVGEQCIAVYLVVDTPAAILK
jgi:hypothetical protein